MDNQIHISKLWNVLPNKLYGMPVPEEKDLQNLSDTGIRSIVCLLEDNNKIDNYTSNGFESLWLPIPDNEAPTLNQVNKLVEFIDLQNQKNNTVAIHCKGGRGRTGTMIASYLISKGATFDEAISKIEENQPNAIKKECQLTFLKALDNK